VGLGNQRGGLGGSWWTRSAPTEPGGGARAGSAGNQQATGVSTGVDEEKAGTFVGRLFEAGLGALDLFTVYIGDRLGLYRALQEGGPATPADLATRAGIIERYAREWLEQQAVTGFLEVDDPGKPEGDRTYSLPSEHAVALTDPESPFSFAPVSRFLVSLGQTMPALLDAYRTGGGVPWSAYGPDAIEAQGDFNRPWLLMSLGTEYLPAVPDIHARLQADPAARVADVACGLGWAGIAIALAYPQVTVDGFDPDQSSIDLARKFAEEKGVADRVRFEVRDGAEIASEGPYDLAIVVESIHDMSRPVEVLSAIREALAPAGSLIVADEKVAESFTAPGDDVERFMYASSVTFCLPAGLAEQPSAATGTVMRPDTLRRYAEAAGFGGFEILEAIQHDFQRFYRLTP
jgi:2-polyprenyl-3-methyl-5-hydroxy-6-metoxy-1,4-benzoquinol methylase